VVKQDLLRQLVGKSLTKD
jgi:aubergine